MKYQKALIFSFVVLGLGAILYYTNLKRANPANLPAETGSNPVDQTLFEAKTVEDGAVTYTITPKSLSDTNETWDFEIALDTHSEELNQDLVALIQLVDDQGIEYQALEWEGAAPGGHHREGILKFSPITPRPTFIELVIQTADRTEKNRLHWTL